MTKKKVLKKNSFRGLLGQKAKDLVDLGYAREGLKGGSVNELTAVNHMSQSPAPLIRKVNNKKSR